MPGCKTTASVSSPATLPSARSTHPERVVNLDSAARGYHSVKAPRRAGRVEPGDRACNSLIMSGLLVPFPGQPQRRFTRYRFRRQTALDGSVTPRRHPCLRSRTRTGTWRAARVPAERCKVQPPLGVRATARLDPAADRAEWRRGPEAGLGRPARGGKMCPWRVRSVPPARRGGRAPRSTGPSARRAAAPSASSRSGARPTARGSPRRRPTRRPRCSAVAVGMPSCSRRCCTTCRSGPTS